MRVTIRIKLALAFSFIIVLSGLIAWLGINNLASWNAALHQVVQGPAQRMILSLEMSEQLLAIVRDHGLAALIATHNPELAARMDRTVTLRDGRLA